MSEDVFKAKRKPKNPITFKVQLNDEQKDAKQVILDNSITVLTGAAGSGKTLLACQVALDQLFTREVEKIIITRPLVTQESMGFLPGDIAEKMDPWLQPIYQNFYALYGKEKVDKEMAEGNIQILPMGYIRGITFVNSKMVLCGDVSQIDLRDKKQSGLAFLRRVEEEVKGFKIVTLKKNHRHEIVQPILEVYKIYED
jgi:phosphate starvation-inducible protein PhoH and related proteins